jgi:hypothetical protein
MSNPNFTGFHFYNCLFLNKQSLVIMIFLTVFSFPKFADACDYTSVIIKYSANADKVELNISNLLATRLKEAGVANVRIVIENSETKVSTNSLNILLGISQNHNEIKLWLKDLQIPPLTDLEPGSEGFLLKKIDLKPIVLAAGVDQRGCLYAVGELLRQVRIRNGILHIPEKMEVRTAPAFEIRGTQVQQSNIAKELAKARPWSQDETQRVILDYALAGANIFSTGYDPVYDFLKSYGLMTQGTFGANTASGAIPEAWEAKESIGRTGYVCLSVPEGEDYMLSLCDAYFKDRPAFDLVKFYGGDGGGCECDKCKPYGLTFIRTVEKMAAIIHKYHPESKVYFTNQKFENADDNAIFSYLQEQPRDWLWAWGYGPGSDAASWQPGHRQNHRMDLFRYPGYGPYSLYPKEILHQLPPQQKLLYYNEITHWKYAQHAFIQMYPRPDRDGNHPPHWSHDIYERRPDQFLTMVYNRLSFYAWPRNYFRVFNDLMPYGIGDITHSSGHHDHFNQWMWQRLLWAPRTSLEDVINDYCKTWFGNEAAPLMAKALLLLEQNIAEQPGIPLPKKKGIKEYYDVVKQAGRLMPKELLDRDWLWRMYMQKGVLDYYTQLNGAQQMELQTRIEKHISASLKNETSLQAITESLTWFDLKESAEMLSLKEEARILGDQSNKLFGERNEGYFNLKHDFIGLGWLKRQLERAKVVGNKNRDELLSTIVDYENPGEGGFYDNLGTNNIAPDVVAGYPYDHGQPYVSQMLSEGNRPSQRSMHYTQNEDKGVTLHYNNLDSHATYKIRFTFVRPWYQERYAQRMNQKKQTIYADDIPIAKDVELPLQMSDFFTYDIPANATADCELTIRLERAADVANGDRVSVEQWRNSGGWGTLASEVWLIKKQ